MKEFLCIDDFGSLHFPLHVDGKFHLFKFYWISNC